MMKIIPVKFLNDLGFEECKSKPLLFKKQITENRCLWRDYRDDKPISYMYVDGNKAACEGQMEIRAIKRIEELIRSGQIIGGFEEIIINEEYIVE